MSEPPGELMGAGRRVGRLSDRKDEKTERKVNGKPALRQTRKRPKSSKFRFFRPEN